MYRSISAAHMLLLLFPSSTGTLREDLCSSGITTPPGPFRRFRACCEKECGSSCGVRGCKSTCCYDNLLASNKFCQEAKDVKCIIPPPMPSKSLRYFRPRRWSVATSFAQLCVSNQISAFVLLCLPSLSLLFSVLRTFILCGTDEAGR